MAPSYRSALEWNDTTLVDSIITHGLAIAQPSLWWSHLSEVSGRALDGLRSSPEVNEDVPLVEEPEKGAEQAQEDEDDEDPMNIRPVRVRTTSTSSWYNVFPSPPQKIQDASVCEPPIQALTIPTIVITPPSTGSTDACRVPVQDSAFSTRLTVPNHLAFNNVFPPMTALNLPTRFPVITRWRWRRGHWEAVLPGLEEQTHRGLFSRAMSLRRRASRQL